MSLSPEDKDFLIRALAMHAALTNTFGSGDFFTQAAGFSRAIEAWAKNDPDLIEALFPRPGTPQPSLDIASQHPQSS